MRVNCGHHPSPVKYLLPDGRFLQMCASCHEAWLKAEGQTMLDYARTERPPLHPSLCVWGRVIHPGWTQQENEKADRAFTEWMEKARKAQEPN
jgi:hypothetical protein